MSDLDPLTMTCSVVSTDNLSTAPKGPFSTENATATLIVPPIQPVERSLDSVMRQTQVENASTENIVHENASDKCQIMESAVVISGNKRKRKKRQEKGYDAVKSNINLSAVPIDAFSTETFTAAKAVPPTHPDEHTLNSVTRQSQVENAFDEKIVLVNASEKSQMMKSVEVSSRNKRKRKKRRAKGHDAVKSNNNLSAVPKGPFSTETTTATLIVPPTQPDERALDSVMRQPQVENASTEKIVHENASNISQIIEVSSRNKRKRKKRRTKGHDANKSNDHLSAVPKDSFSTETSTATMAVPPTHPDEHTLDSVMRQSQVENALNEKSVLGNASEKSQMMKSVEVSSRNKRKRKKRRAKGHDANKSNDHLSAVPKESFSTEASTAALAAPPTHPDEHTLDSVKRHSQVGNALNEKNMLENASEKSQIMTGVEVSSRNKRKRKKRQEKGPFAIKSNDNLPAVPKDALSVETSTAAMVMPPTHPFQHSVDPFTMQYLVENEGKENHVLQHVTDGYLAVSNLDGNSNKEDKKRKRKKARHNYVEANANLFSVPKDNTSLEASTPILDFPPPHSGQYDMSYRLSQEVNGVKVQNMIGKATDGSTAVANEEISSRKKNKKGNRRKSACKEIECDINHYEVPKDAFSPETCTVTSDMPSQYTALDVVMSQCPEKDQGRDLNMVEKAMDGSPSAEVKSRTKNKGEERRKIRHDFLQGNVNLSSVSKGDMSTLVNKHDHYKASHFSLGRAISSHPEKKLLVLDLNGLLADIVLGVPKGYKPVKKIHDKAVFKRPFCDDFLKFCFDKFHVGIWSSRKRQNVCTAIKILVGASASKLLFAWDQSHCTVTQFQTIVEKGKPLMLKELRKLWEKSRRGLLCNKGEFNETNTLLLDDSPYKALRNPMHTAIFPYPYRYSDTNDASLGPGGDIRVYLEGLAMAENVQEYVASHPFGQPPITESSPHWNFYCEVRGQGVVARQETKKETKKRRWMEKKKQKMEIA